MPTVSVGTRCGARVPRHQRVQWALDRPAQRWAGHCSIAIVFTALALLHLVFLRIPEDSARAQRQGPAARLPWQHHCRSPQPKSLFALIIFSTFNNLIGGVYMALMDPYGLELARRALGHRARRHLVEASSSVVCWSPSSG